MSDEVWLEDDEEFCPRCLAGTESPEHREKCAPTPCPVCGGAGIVDTSPPGVDAAPWLATDTDCARCDGTGEIDPTTYEPDIEESP